MTGLPSIPRSSFVTALFIILTLLIPLARPAMAAEFLHLFRTAEQETPRYTAPPAETRRQAEQKSLLAVNESGDVVIQHANVSVILAYITPDDRQQFQNQSRDLLPRECAPPNGFNLKMAIAF